MNKTHLDILKQEWWVWNEWRKSHPEIRPDLSSALLMLRDLSLYNLNNVDLIGASFNNAILRGTDLRSAKLDDVNLLYADLAGAKLTGASMTFADFNYANLSGADLRETDLRSAVIRNATLTGADLTGATMGWTQIGNTDMSECKGLESIRHTGSSSIGIDTVYRSKGSLSDEYLRRAGVPEDFIAYINSSERDIRQSYYACFISHSSKDKTFCDRLNNDLRGAGAVTWYYEEDAKGGEDDWEQIEWAIKHFDKFLLVCSNQSLSSSPVIRELGRAIRREDDEKKKIIFPITIDRYVMDEWKNPRKEDVIHYHVMDFTKYQDEVEYKAMLNKLLTNLSNK